MINEQFWFGKIYRWKSCIFFPRAMDTHVSEIIARGELTRKRRNFSRVERRMQSFLFAIIVSLSALKIH